MAWAQRDEAVAFPSPYGESDEIRRLDAPARCAGCNSVLTGVGVLIGRRRYCSMECVIDVRHDLRVPGNYLG